MQSIGERLEEARKRRGVTIREASEETKILGEYLNSFESNNFSINIPEIYVRGFLRSYANFLKINSEKIVTDFNATLLSNGKSPKREHRELYGRLELKPTIASEDEAALPGDEAPHRAEPKPSGSSGFNLWSDLSSRFNIDKPLAIKLGIIAAAAILTIAILIWIISSLISSGNADKSLENAGQVEAISDLPTETITLIAKGDVRVSVIQFEPRQILYEGPLSAGESMDIEKTGKVILTYDQGSNLIVEKDGQKFGMPSGGKGRSAVE